MTFFSPKSLSELQMGHEQWPFLKQQTVLSGGTVSSLWIIHRNQNIASGRLQMF